jgi:peptidoglycan/xylan/chitin deacetylase (PgdA/CDA1 family)
VIASYAEARPLPERAALVTFDDGYRNNLTLAADVLRDKGIPCVFHITTSYIGTKRVLWPDEVVNRIVEWPLPSIPLPDGGEQPLGPDVSERRVIASRLREWCKRIPAEEAEAYLEKLQETPMEMAENEELFGFLDWDEVRALRRQGFDIGSHTVSHPILTRIDSNRLMQELADSKQRIEDELNEPCTCIAYPNGGAQDVSAAVFEAARRTGYALGFTVADRHSEPGEDMLGISRICVQGHFPFSFFEYRTSGVDQVIAKQNREFVQ